MVTLGIPRRWERGKEMISEQSGFYGRRGLYLVLNTIQRHAPKKASVGERCQLSGAPLPCICLHVPPVWR